MLPPLCGIHAEEWRELHSMVCMRNTTQRVDVVHPQDAKQVLAANVPPLLCPPRPSPLCRYEVFYPHDGSAERHSAWELFEADASRWASRPPSAMLSADVARRAAQVLSKAQLEDGMVSGPF